MKKTIICLIFIVLLTLVSSCCRKGDPGCGNPTIESALDAGDLYYKQDKRTGLCFAVKCTVSYISNGHIKACSWAHVPCEPAVLALIDLRLEAEDPAMTEQFPTK